MLKINLKTSKASEAYEELEKALKNGEKVVVLIEGVDLADDRFMELLVDRVEAGKSGDLDDSQGKKSHMIFLLTREDDECEHNEHVVIPMVLKCKKLSSGLVNNKRKPESDAVSTMVKMKNPRIQEEEDVACDISNIKKEFSRQLSFGSNALDLNLRVEAAEQEEEAAAKSATQEQWVKDVFQTGLVTVKNGGKEGISVINLCLRGIDMIDQGEVYEEEGFMGTCLPNTIQVFFVD
ncbi:hypothetical protein F2Q70_00013651 [Brassica cretica]|uniref:Uncharacterized protein n=1 Tax=Brassica cretica TaxID=69181 RepID=A0A8S9M8A3_BRACR|nr:hypothetical protein F2Q68_00006683 [Brassica cretica]KAF2614677.1 hypothetical protein F2Q70_00013651 [Brassica cretica]